MEQTAATRPSPPGRAARASRADRIAWIAFGVAATLSAALILWESRRNTFYLDEVVHFQSLGGDFDAEAIFTPFSGHLIAVAYLLYGTAFDSIGPEHGFFRAVGVIGLLVCALLVFIYLRRRVDPLVALAPAVVLLFLGSSWEVLLWPASIATFVFSLAAGVGALLLLERDDRLGDIGACVLLIVALASHSIGLAFVGGVAVIVLLRVDRWHRAWVFLIPLALYAVWWVWALRFDEVMLGPEARATGRLTAINAWLVPSYFAQLLAFVIGAVTGLSATISGESLNPTIELEAGWGRVLALVAIVALVVRLTRGKVPRSLWGTLAGLLVFWASLVLTASNPNATVAPNSWRYIFPGAVMLFLVAGNAVSGIRFSRRVVAAVLAVAAVAVMTNVRQLHDGDLFLNDYSDRARTQLAMLELARDRVPPGFTPGPPLVPTQLLVEAGPYLEAVDRFGSFAFPIREVLEQSPEVRDGADRFLASALGIGLTPSRSGGKAPEGCAEIAPPSGGAPASSEIPPGGVVLRARAPATVALGRFSDAFPVDLGRVEPGQPASMQIPKDRDARPWRLAVTSVLPVDMCPFTGTQSASAG